MTTSLTRLINTAFGMITLLLASNCVAQSEGSNPNGFFPKDYVQPSHSNKLENKSKNTDLKNSGFTELGSEVTHETDTLKPTPTIALLDKPGEAIEWLGLVVDVGNRDLSFSILNRLDQLTERLHIRAGKIYLICDPSIPLPPPFQRLIIKLRIRGAEVSKVPEVPTDLNIKLSPTWLIQTNSGTTILEGLLTPERNLTTRGEFVAPNSAAPK